MHNSISFYLSKEKNKIISENEKIIENYPQISKESCYRNELYSWNIQVSLESPSEITYIYSPSHKININYENEMKTLALEREEFHGEWNYTLYPR